MLVGVFGYDIMWHEKSDTIRLIKTELNRILMSLGDVTIMMSKLCEVL